MSAAQELKIEPGTKHDDGKPRYDLLPEPALEAMARVLAYGAQKYGEHNWRAGMSWSRLFAATLRHLWAFWRGEDNDPESGLPHLAHAQTNIAFLIAFTKDKPVFDDRWKGDPEPDITYQIWFSLNEKPWREAGDKDSGYITGGMSSMQAALEVLDLKQKMYPAPMWRWEIREVKQVEGLS